MDLALVKNAVTSKVARQVLMGKKHSPAIMFAGGVAGVVVTTVLACRATLQLEEVLDEADAARVDARALRHNNEKDRRRDQAYISARTAIKIGKLYAPAIGVGALSVTALTGSHVVLTKRNAGLTAAYAALDRGFRDYRQRVVNEVGEDKERELRYDVETIHERIDDTKKGEVQVREIRAIRGDLSQYARLFGPNTTKEWQQEASYNAFFIRCQQNYLNDRLKARGHVLLNDAYDSLGLERTKAGCVVGWVLNGKGDNFIDFGMFRDDNMEAIYDFMTGREGAIWLDFNVDGVVYDLI